ncbi:hypothetical protein L1887_08993 [Cichorium endivia]|nr:hypothetical protein L1887_08993 [Cichorium endivia]
MKKRNLSMAMKMKIHMFFFNPVSEGKPPNPPSNLRNQPPQSRMVFMQSFRTALLIWRSLLVGVDTALPPEELTRLYDSVFLSFDEDQNGTIDL